MCLQDNNFVQLGICPHGAFHLRVGNTSLHLTEKQVLSVYMELKRCIKSDCDQHEVTETETQNWRERFGQSHN